MEAQRAHESKLRGAVFPRGAIRPYPSAGLWRGEHDVRPRVTALLFALVVLSLPLQGQGFKFGGLEINVNFMVCALFTLVVLFRLPHFPLSSDKWYLLFLGWCVLSIVHNFGIHTSAGRSSSPLGAQGIGATQVRWLYHFARLCLVWLFFRSVFNYLVATPRSVGNLISWLRKACWFLLLYGTYQLIGAPRGWPLIAMNNLHYGQEIQRMFSRFADVDRVFATFAEPKGYALFLNFVLPLLIGRYLLDLKTRHSRVAHDPSLIPRFVNGQLVLIVGLVFHLFLTASVGGLVAFFLQMLVLVVLARRKPVLIVVAALILAIGGASVLWIDKSPAEFFRLMTWELTRTETGTAGWYRALARINWRMILERPILGHGPGGLVFARPSFWIYGPFEERISRVGWGDGSGVVLYVLGSAGFVGGLFFAAFFISHIRAATTAIMRRRLSSQGEFLLPFAFASFIGLAIHFVVLAVWNQLHIWLALALVAFLCQGQGLRPFKPSRARAFGLGRRTRWAKHPPGKGPKLGTFSATGQHGLPYT